jgi:WASH complex subunit 7
LIERAVGDTVESLPDEYSAAVTVNLCPQERVLALELIDSGKEEKFFKKVLAVFAYLCDEIHELNEIAENTFYPKVIMFGHSMSGVDDDSLPTPGRAEEQMGNMLPFLQELSNFVERCHNCAVNMIQQLAKLYNGREKLFQSTFQYVHLLPVYESLSQLLGILVTLDASVAQNTHMAPAWSDFKRMMQFVRDKPDSYGADAATVQRFERVLVQLDASVLRGATFKACIELDFEELVPVDDDVEPETVNVRNNPHMLNELFHCLRAKIDRAEAAIGTHAETTERRSMVGYVALYALYRRLTPAYSEPDAKFYRRLWALQSKLPVVVLCGKLVWMLPEFLEEFARLGQSQCVYRL